MSGGVEDSEGGGVDDHVGDRVSKGDDDKTIEEEEAGEEEEEEEEEEVVDENGMDEFAMKWRKMGRCKKDLA